MYSLYSLFSGTIGFFACFWFVTKIYSVVKVDWRIQTLQTVYGWTLLPLINLWNIQLHLKWTEHYHLHLHLHLLVPSEMTLPPTDDQFLCFVCLRCSCVSMCTHFVQTMSSVVSCFLKNSLHFMSPALCVCRCSETNKAWRVLLPHRYSLGWLCSY